MVGYGEKARETIQKEQANQAKNAISYQITAMLTYLSTTHTILFALAFHTPMLALKMDTNTNS